MSPKLFKNYLHLDSETILPNTIDLDNVAITRTEGGSGLTPIFRFLKLFGNKYERYIDFEKGAVFKQIKLD